MTLYKPNMSLYRTDTRLTLLLETLFGNKNVTQILLFLFVNGQCYGTGLSRHLDLPLTPIQKGLTRLEKGGIVTSEYQGKTRIYRFNAAFPLLSELEQLIKKGYTLLPPEEKKQYYVAEERKKNFGVNKIQILLDFWNKLSSVREVSFHASSKSQHQEGWNGRGAGEVTITKPSHNTLVFNEKGFWKNKDMQFTNSFRWTLDRAAGVISLEHLRRGPDHPIFLFHLAPSSSGSLTSIDSHLCDGDTYFGHVLFDEHTLRLRWRVIGPKKNEQLDYYYL